MPWTFAHPAAILPLRRWCPAKLNLAALAIGALTPDFGYYLHARSFARFAHTPKGSLLACLPAGVVLLVLFYLLRGPLWHLLPQPHRRVLGQVVASPVPRRPGQLLAALAALLIGAWTHILWDASSHRHGWLVTHVPWLRSSAFTLYGEAVPFYEVVQHSSTLFGTACLVIAYRSWLRRQGIRTILASDAADRWRHSVLASLLLVALLSGLLMAHFLATTFHAFLYHAAIQIVVVFVPLWSLAAVICYPRRPAAPAIASDPAHGRDYDNDPR